LLRGRYPHHPDPFPLYNDEYQHKNISSYKLNIKLPSFISSYKLPLPHACTVACLHINKVKLRFLPMVAICLGRDGYNPNHE